MTTPDDLARLRAETTEALRQVLLRLGPNALAIAGRGEPIRLSGNEIEATTDAVMPVLARLARQRDQARALVRDMTDPGECWFDHHGYCQEHGWFDTDPKCPHARAKELLPKEDEQ